MSRKSKHIWLTGLFVLGGLLLSSILTRATARDVTPSATFDFQLYPTDPPDDMDATATYTATASPTLGKLITRTPAPSATCPPELDGVPLPPLDDSAWSEEKGDTESLLTYLNNGGSPDKLKAMRGGQIFDVRKTDVTDDKTNDLVIAARPPWMGAFLYVFACHDGKYFTAALLSFHDEGGQAGIRAIQDMNSDGVQDIVYSYQPIVGTHGYGGQFTGIYEWDGQALQSLISSPDAGQTYFIGASSEGRFERIEKRDNGTYELVLVQTIADKDTYYGGPVTGRSSLGFWVWNGVAFTYLCSRAYEPATYRIHAVIDGENDIQCGDYAQAMADYGRAIFDNSLLAWSNAVTWNPKNTYFNPDERTYIEAFSRYRIILLHLVQKQIEEAKTDYSILQRKYPDGTTGHQFAALTKAFWDTYQAQGSIAAGCQSAIDYARDRVELLAPMTQISVEIQTFNPRPVDNWAAICPFK